MLTQVHNAQVAASAIQGVLDPASDTRNLTRYPSYTFIPLHLFTHFSIIGIAAVTLAALWTRAPRYYFAIFLVWLVAFYAMMLVFAWKGILWLYNQKGSGSC